MMSSEDSLSKPVFKLKEINMINIEFVMSHYLAQETLPPLRGVASLSLFVACSEHELGAQPSGDGKGSRVISLDFGRSMAAFRMFISPVSTNYLRRLWCSLFVDR